jgi:uncharacterized protein YndB with AHSA1/START domain
MSPGSRFVYVTYIRSTPEKVWAALTTPEFTKQFWAGTWPVSDWKPGSEWKIMIPDGRIGDSGRVLEIDHPKRLVLSWRNEFLPELKNEMSRATFDLEQQGDMVKLTLVHESEHADSLLIDTLSNGWPVLLSSLKSLLETGESLVATRSWPEGY